MNNYGPFHLRYPRLRDFADGLVLLEETEQAHLIVCTRCSYAVADWAMGGIEIEPKSWLEEIWKRIAERRD